MAILNFDKIYIIQSLSEAKGDDLTGTLLHDDVLQYFSLRYPDKEVSLIDVDNPTELKQALIDIAKECELKKIKPIIHFEMHGLEDKSGLKLNTGYSTWEDIYDNLIEINIASEFNLFVTMAVCYGNYAMSLIRPLNIAPFNGVIGSFDAIKEEDLYMRYSAFYLELFSSLDFDKAVDALHNANPTLPSHYKYINAEQIFKNVYQQYFDTHFSNDKLKDRFHATIKEQRYKFKDGNEQVQMFSHYKAKMIRTKMSHYEKDKERFFMMDKYPDHRNLYCVGWKPQ